MQRFSANFAFIVISLMILSACFEEVTPTENNNDDNGDRDTFEFSHTLAAGESNEAFVTDNEFEELIIEIQFMPDAEPEEQAIVELTSFLEQHLQKTEIIITEPVEITSGGEEIYFVNDIEQIEELNRQFYSEPNILAAYILFLDGEFENADALAYAQFNTSVSVSRPVVDRVSGVQQFEPSKSSVEATVMKHQFGHLMGLVNNGTEMVQFHHDEPNGAHCTFEECLMNFRLNSANYFETLFHDAEFEFGHFCSADIDAIKN